MIGVGFTSTHAFALAIDRERFRYHIVLSVSHEEVDRLRAWFTDKEHDDTRRDVVLLDKANLLDNPDVRAAIERAGGAVVFDTSDILEDRRIPILDGNIRPDGRWDVRISMDAVNRAIEEDSVDFTKIERMPSFLKVDDELPRVMSFANTMKVLRSHINTQDLEPFIPTLAGFLAGTISRRVFDRQCKDLITIGARPDVLEEYRFYCMNEGKVVRAAYRAVVKGSIDPKTAVAYYYDGERRHRDLIEEIAEIDVIVRTGPNVRFLGKQDIPQDLVETASKVRKREKPEQKQEDVIKTKIFKLKRRLRENLLQSAKGKRKDTRSAALVYLEAKLKKQGRVLRTDLRP